MPQLIWLYLTALLYYRTSVSCVALAEALETVSHDRLTRLLQGNWSGHTLLDRAIRTLFVGDRGYLMIDDTVLAKPFATAIEGLAWVFSSQEQKPVYGLSVVLLIQPASEQILVANSQNPDSFVEVSRINSGVSSDVRQFATSIRTSFTSVRTEADPTAWGKHLTAPP